MVNQLFFAFCKFTSLFIFCKSTVCFTFCFGCKIWCCFVLQFWKSVWLHFVSLLFLLFLQHLHQEYFILVHREGAYSGHGGENNFKTLAQELGQFEYSYLGEKFVKIPRGNNFPPIMQGLFFDYNDTTITDI